MTDAAKSDVQVVDDILKVHTVPFWVCEEIAAAVAANAAPRIRAETVEEVLRLLEDYTITTGKQKAIRALAAAPPGFKCVSVEPTEAMLNAGAASFAAAKYAPDKIGGYRDHALAIYKAMLAESGK